MATKPQEIAPLVPPADNSIVNIIARAASDPSVDVEKLQALLAMQERVVERQNKLAFDRAMVEAQSEIGPVARDADNEHTRSRYARLEAIDTAIRPIYTGHGFSVRFKTGTPTIPGAVCVVCVVSHRDGHSEEFPLEAPPDNVGSKGTINKPGVQAYGSTVTYLRRYSTLMAFNVVLTNDPDDDDGEATRRTSYQRAQASGPDPKAVAWKDALVAKYAQVQSEAGIDSLLRNNNTNYNTMRDTWPALADEIDAARDAARVRVRGVQPEAPATTAPATADEPQVWEA